MARNSRTATTVGKRSRATAVGPPAGCTRAPTSKKVSRRPEQRTEKREWQRPRRPAAPRTAPPPEVTSTYNYYDQLYPEPENPTHQDFPEADATPEVKVPRIPRTHRRHTTRKVPRPAAQRERHSPGIHSQATKNAIQAAQLIEKPYQPSYFLPGKVEGKAALFLLDTGCNTNLLSKHVFDRLAPRVRQGLEPCGSHGIMADGTRLPFYGIIQLEGRLRDIKFCETFVISQINEDAILGMPFLTSHGCTMEFGHPTVIVDGRELTCTDRHGRLLISHVHVVKRQVIAPGTEAALLCRLSIHNHPPLGLIESQSSELPIASSLNCPDDR